MSGHSTGEDPYRWLEEVDGADPMAWVAECNRATRAALAEDPGFGSLRKRLRVLFDAEDRVPERRQGVPGELSACVDAACAGTTADKESPGGRHDVPRPRCPVPAGSEGWQDRHERLGVADDGRVHG